MQPIFNRTVLMSGAQYMNNESPINPYMHGGEPFDVQKAIDQHTAIKNSLEAIGVKVLSVEPPHNCQDGVFTANWALTRGNKAVMSSLPNVRQPEESYALEALKRLGLEVYTLPREIKFSGQGDALPCGEYAFIGTGYRTDLEAHKFVEDKLGYKVISLQAIPELDEFGEALINHETGWPDSNFYDLDLAISILRPPIGEKKGLIAWCPEAFIPESQDKIRNLDFVDKIEVPLREAVGASACNLVSTGNHVVMNANAPVLEASIRFHGLGVTSLHNEELAKNGGSVRCTTLTIFD